MLDEIVFRPPWNGHLLYFQDVIQNTKVDSLHNWLDKQNKK